MNKSRKFAALIIITVILTAFTGVARAQDDDEEDHGMYIVQPKVFYGGLVAGANFSQVDGDYFAGYHRVGANVGGIVYTQLARHVAVSLEILYSQKGSKSNIPEPSPANGNILLVKYGIAVNYAEIPVMINYFDKRKSHFGIGVSYSRLVNSNEISETEDTFNHITYQNFNQMYPFKKDAFDFLAGVDLHLWKGLFLNIRFQYSLVPIRTDIPPPDYARAEQYNNMWVVRLMYLAQ
jgi:outer membrane protein with beta-barrel domain